MNSVNIGERLTQLRAIMAAELPAPNHWSRTRLAQDTGVPLAALTLLEDTGCGDAEVLAAVLRFYQGRGVNLAWVLAPDNADISLYGVRDICQDEKPSQEEQPLAVLRRLLQPLIAELNAGPTLTPEALRSLLTEIQQGIHHVLKHLLPPRRVQWSEADLRAFHKFFPPVPTQSTGWHSVGRSNEPYHYLEAGKILPLCGEDVPFQIFSPVIKDVPNSEKCETCRSRVDETAPAFTQPTAENAP